jgi:hypothetical protein
MAVINGSDLYVFRGATRIAHATSHSVSMKMATRDTSNKDTGKFNTKGVGRMDVTASSDNLMVYVDYAALGVLLLARTPLTLYFGEQTGAVETGGELVGGTLDGAKFYASGSFIITGLDQNAGDQANASYTVSFENADGSFAFHSTNDLRVDLMGINASASGATDGIVGAFPAGGTKPYTYVWSGAVTGTTQTKTSVPVGVCNVVVTDAASGTVSGSFTIGY